MTLIEQTCARFAVSRASLRLKATALHLLVSLLIVFLAAAVVFLVWFPQGLADLLRGASLFWLLSTCDAILGPVLSFVICSPTKSRRMLVFDYAVIAAIQLSALAYGLNVVAASRPVYVVFSVDRLDLVSAFEVEAQDARDLEALRVFPTSWFGPRPVMLRLPEDTAGRNEALSLELSGGELQVHPRFLAPYSVKQVLSRAQPLDVLAAKQPQLQKDVRIALQSAALGPDAAVWLPARSRFGFHTALLRRSDASIIAFLPGDPY
jgi:hypothetical protein